jgi:hypothetical protein
VLVAPGPAARADAIYRSVDADGHVVYADHADPSAAPQVVVSLDTPSAPPPVIHFCWTNCFTLQLNHGLYTRVDGSDETWTIERFTPQSFELHRHNAPAAWNGFNADVAYAGHVSDDRLIDVTVAGNPVPSVSAAWGQALASLPGSNAERDARNAAAASAPVPFAPASDQELRAAVAPPPLPDYGQPPCPADGYLWTPGYWGWGTAGYYWVPGLWVQPPRIGVLWTPGYWGFFGTAYVFHPGYWGPHVGYYGGINYGYGYVGVGFAGGHWEGNAFAYNSAVANVNGGLIHHTYQESVVAPAFPGRVSYNGGPGGTTAVATAQERAAASEAHVPPTAEQRLSLQQAARGVSPMPHSDGMRRAVVTTQRPAIYHAPRAPGIPQSNAAPAAAAHVVAHTLPPPGPRLPTSNAPRVSANLTAATPARSVSIKH